MRSTERRLVSLLAVVVALTAAKPAVADDREFEGSADGWTQVPPPPGDAPYDDAAQPPSSSADVSVDLAAPGASVGFSSFQDGLAPYGEWVTVSSYGRVWRPVRVASGWRPYYYGRWEWTDEGWLWVSDEPWGWATYHYGRWAYDSYYGWVWIPGSQWAPAWVVWRYSPEYIGWAPLGPGFSVYVTNYPAVYGWWTFVPCRRFVGVPVPHVAFTGRQVHGIYGGTHPAPPRVVMQGALAPAWGGPARPYIEQHVGRPIVPVRVQPVASPRQIGTVQQSGLVQVYRPETHVVARPVAPATPNALPAGHAPSTGARASPAPGPAATAAGFMPRAERPNQPSNGAGGPAATGVARPPQAGGWPAPGSAAARVMPGVPARPVPSGAMGAAAVPRTAPPAATGSPAHVLAPSAPVQRGGGGYVGVPSSVPTVPPVARPAPSAPAFHGVGGSAPAPAHASPPHAAPPPAHAAPAQRR